MAKEGPGHWSGTNSAGRQSEIFDLGGGKRAFMNERANGTWNRHESRAKDPAQKDTSKGKK